MAGRVIRVERSADEAAYCLRLEDEREKVGLHFLTIPKTELPRELDLLLRLACGIEPVRMVGTLGYDSEWRCRVIKTGNGDRGVPLNTLLDPFYNQKMILEVREANDDG
jgi:hypothetical protein